MGLTDTRVSVSDLDAHLNYTFTVEAHSGVSLLIGQVEPPANRPPSSSALTTSLLYTGGCYCYEAVQLSYLCCGRDICYLPGSDSSGS